MNHNSTSKRLNVGYYTLCPRCGWKSFEHLETHNHCTNCLYYETSFQDMSLSEALEAEKFLIQLEGEKLANKKSVQKPKLKKANHEGDLGL